MVKGAQAPRADWSKPQPSTTTRPASAIASPRLDGGAVQAGPIQTKKEDTERNPPDGYQSWEKVRDAYELYGPHISYTDASPTVQSWLEGRKPDTAEYEGEKAIFEALDELGGDKVGELHTLVHRFTGGGIGRTLYAVCDARERETVMKAIDAFLHEAYPGYYEFQSFEDLLGTALAEKGKE